MRDTGPIAKTLTGDQDESVGNISVARTQLGILKNGMKLGGITQGSRSVTLPDGTTMRVTSINGIDQVHISTPQPGKPALPVEVPETPYEPEFPGPVKIHVPQPQVGGLAFYAGYWNQNIGDPTFNKFSDIPLIVNGVQVSKPNGQAFVLNKGAAYVFGPSAGVDPEDDVAVFPTGTILANVSPEGAVLPPGQQVAHQTDWTLVSEFGVDLASTNIVGADVIASEGGEVDIETSSGAVVKVPGLSHITFNGTLVDVNYHLTGKLPNGTTLKADYVIAKCIWPYGVGIIDATPDAFPVFNINGVRPYLNNVGTPTSGKINGNSISQTVVEITTESAGTSTLNLSFGAIDENANVVTGARIFLTDATYTGSWPMVNFGQNIQITGTADDFGTIADSGVLTVTAVSGEKVSYNISLMFTLVEAPSS